MNRVLVLALLLASSCGTTPANPADAATPDLAASDLAVPPAGDMAMARDLAVPRDFPPGTDLAVLPDLVMVPDSDPVVDLRGPIGDLSFPGCKLDVDCRLFSSMCATKPCQCLALRVGAPDPVCMGPMVMCLMDPCAGKKAVCDRPVETCIVQ